MRYDLPSFRVDKRDFLAGSNSYDSYPEGGFLASSVGMNSFAYPGYLSQAPVLGSTVTASLPKSGVIAWGIGGGTSSPVLAGLYADADNHGSWYLCNTSTGAMTLVGTVDTGHHYTLGVSDTVFYNGKFYTTSDTDIVEQALDLTSRDLTFWTTTKSQTALTSGVPHPLLVYESIMYIADGRYLHKLDGTTASSQVWDAPPDHVITAMIEFNGLIYICAEPYNNLDGSVHGLTQMFSWDGLLESWYEQYYLDYRVNAMFVYKNRLYTWNNHFLGQWTGSEMAPVRPVSSQVFKCQITATSSSMVYADGMTIVRYGAPFVPGMVRKFYNYLDTTVTNFRGIISAYADSLIVTQAHATAAPVYFLSNIDTPSSTGSRTFVFNSRSFKRAVKIRGIVVEVSAMTTGQIVKAGFYDDAGTATYGMANGGELDGSVEAMEGKTYYRFDVKSAPTRWIEPLVTVTGNAVISAIDYLYDGSEVDLNK